MITTRVTIIFMPVHVCLQNIQQRVNAQMKPAALLTRHSLSLPYSLLPCKPRMAAASWRLKFTFHVIE